MNVQPENDDAFSSDDFIWHKTAGATLVVYKDKPNELVVLTGCDGWETLSIDEVDQMYEALGKIRQWLHETKKPPLTEADAVAIMDEIESLPNAIEQARAVQNKMNSMEGADKTTLLRSDRFRRWVRSKSVYNVLMSTVE